MDQNLTIKVNSTYKYLQIWNGIFSLTDKELKILSLFVDINNEKNLVNICDPEIKKLVAKELGFTDHNTLNNYVKKFKDKGVLLKSGSNYRLNKLLNTNTKSVRINLRWQDGR
jgi:IS1 family transposase|tara:strand:- start:475 stop:813 length:339 start_codon:yes stop_codon:yes gene_type:complete